MAELVLFKIVISGCLKTTELLAKFSLRVSETCYSKYNSVAVTPKTI